MFSLKIFYVLLFVSGTAVANYAEYLKCVYLSRVGPCVDSRYRTIDGTCNNLKDINFGKSYWPYGRLLPPTYSDGKHDLPLQSDKSEYPSARIVSNLMFPAGNPQNKNYTLALMSLAQLIAHDMGLAEGTQAGTGSNSNPVGCCTNNKFGKDSSEGKCAADIVIPPNDPDYSAAGQQCLAFGRTSTTSKYLCYLKNFDEQINLVSSYLDASFLYGNLQYPATKLREYSGGRLKTEKKGGKEFPPSEANPKSLCPRAKAGEKKCYLTGDERANQNPQLTVLQIIFLRLHNFIADKLQALNPKWTDEMTFQEGRRIVIALWQHFVYDEILPNYIGLDIMKKYGLINLNPGTCVNDYNSAIDASTRQEFATGAWRYFHSLIFGDIQTFNAKREVLTTVKLSDWIDRGQSSEFSDELNFETIAVGLTVQPPAETDQFYDPEIKSKFNKDDKTNLGTDLLSFDITRSRDHAIATYVVIRKFCNLSVPTSWEDFGGDVGQQFIDKLKTLYVNFTSVEYMSAGHNENHIPGTLVGPTHACIIAVQFLITRIADRYFFETCDSKIKFTSEQLAAIKKVPLARVFCDTTDIESVQAQVTKIAGPDNPIVKCTDITSLNLNLWKNETVPAEESSSIMSKIAEKYYDIYSYYQGYTLKKYG